MLQKVCNHQRFPRYEGSYLIDRLPVDIHSTRGQTGVDTNQLCTSIFHTAMSSWADRFITSFSPVADSILPTLHTSPPTNQPSTHSYPVQLVILIHLAWQSTPTTCDHLFPFDFIYAMHFRFNLNNCCICSWLFLTGNWTIEESVTTGNSNIFTLTQSMGRNRTLLNCLQKHNVQISSSSEYLQTWWTMNATTS